MADKVEGTIENLGVTSTSEITLPDESGSMANTVSGTIVNSYSTAKIKATTDWGEVGGLVGTMSGSTISNCYFAGRDVYKRQAQALGLAEGALETTIEYVKERKQFGRSIGQFQNTQFQLADMATKVEAAKMCIRDRLSNTYEMIPTEIPSEML